MANIEYERVKVNTKPFNDIVGEEIVAFLFEHAPQKVTARLAMAVEHFGRVPSLVDVDEEMGAIRLIAAEEELVVAIFEWLKLKEDKYPDHKEFVRKFKNHVVKLTFYPVLLQFRFIIGDMLKGFGLKGLEHLNWTAKPVVDGAKILLALHDAEGKELIRHNPFSIMISRGEVTGQEIVPELLAELTQTIKDQHGSTLKEFLLERADFRNKLLYATDAGSMRMGGSLAEMSKQFEQTYHDLLWVVALLVGGEPPSKDWGLVSQFIGLYREALIVAGVLRKDNTLTETAADLG